MFADEKTPLRGSENFVPYASMYEHHGRLRRKMKQYQCTICATVILTFFLAIIIALLSYPDPMPGPELENNPSLLKMRVGETQKSLVFDPAGNLKSPMSDPMGEVVCVQSKYRTANGTCNNLLHPTWGASGQPLKRLLPPDYCDGISTSRCSTTKFPLPSPYLITAKIKADSEEVLKQFKTQDSIIKNLLWGTFIFHDLVDIPEFGPVQPNNSATSFLDGSNIYGNGTEAENKTRSFIDGLLLLETGDNTTSSKSSDFKCKQSPLHFDFFDKIMKKQHNLIASKLKVINPLWTDEKLFQESKRIVIAQIQHVTYNEFLNDIGDKTSKIGSSSIYSATVDTSVSDVFATAAFKSILVLMSETRSEPRDASCDFFSAAHSIQRARDYGLPGYLKWREYCGLTKPLDFLELEQLLKPNISVSLGTIYQDINDMDLLVGLVSEAPVNGSMFGEVGLCLIADQFERLKLGDRYWYEIDQLPQKFSEEQLMEIQKTTISKLVCDNLVGSKLLLDMAGPLNCSTIPKINLTLWAEVEPAKTIEGITTKLYVGEIKSKKLLQSSSKNILKKAKNSTTTVVKRSASFMMTAVNVSANLNGESVYDVTNQKPPILIPLDRIIDLYAYTASADINFVGKIEGDVLTGNIDLLLRDKDPTVKKTQPLSVQVKGDIAFNWGTSIELDGNTLYKCKILFQSYAKKLSQGSNELESVEPIILKEELKTSDEQCTIMLVGMFYQRPFYCSLFSWWCLEGKLFYWSGETKLVFKSTTNSSLITTTSSSMNNKGLKLSSIKQKTTDVIVEKLFASVSVVSGKITGNFKNEEPFDLFNGVTPIEIPLAHIISPNAYDISSEIIFTGTPIDDNSVVGKFSVPYYPTVGTAMQKSFSANFTLDIVYKYGGSIGIIDPSKTYICQLMFPSVKRSSATSESDRVLMSTKSKVQTVKGKTPFGESCAVSLGGNYKSNSVFCYVTPWWCSDEKVFVWNGDIEFTIKKKYNATDANGVLVKKQSDNVVVGTPLPTDGFDDFVDKFCCGHRLGGKVRSGWIQVKDSGLFQASRTIWSGELPTAIELPIFWKPGTSEDKADLSDMFGHEVIWSCSIFQSSIQGSFSFPQYVGHGPPPLVNWIKGKFFLDLVLDEKVSLYKTIIPSSSYRSRVNFHTEHGPDLVPFSNSPQKRDPLAGEAPTGIRAPLILLGKYTPDHKSFVWNGSFIIVFTKTASDFWYL